MDLTKKKCVPCEGGVLPLDFVSVTKLLQQVSGWSLKNGHLFKEFKFEKFAESIDFVNKVANIAESEGHHPDFAVHFRNVEMEIWTHAINGLSENDFILAAKIDKITN